MPSTGDVDQLVPQHLSHLVEWELLDGENPLRALVGAEALTGVSRQLFAVYLTIPGGNDEGDYLFPPPVRWNAHDGRLVYRGVFLQGELDLPGIHVQSARDDQLLGASRDGQVPVVRTYAPYVAGSEPFPRVEALPRSEERRVG